MADPKEPRRIMLIDDDPEEHHLIARQLRNVPNSHFCAFTTLEMALAALRQTPADLILLDARRGGQSSLSEAITQLRHYAQNCPIVGISTIDLSPGAVSTLALAAFILKDDLTSTRIEQFLQNR